MVLKIEPKQPGPLFGEELADECNRFYENSLRPSFKRVLKEGDFLYLDFSSTKGSCVNTAAFYKKTFGRLVEEFGVDVVYRKLGLVSNTPEMIRLKMGKVLSGEMEDR